MFIGGYYTGAIGALFPKSPLPGVLVWPNKPVGLLLLPKDGPESSLGKLIYDINL